MKLTKLGRLLAARSLMRNKRIPGWVAKAMNSGKGSLPELVSMMK